MTDSLTVTILGRTMPYQAPNAAQLALMARAAKVATTAGQRMDRDEDAGKKLNTETFMTGLTATAQALDIIQKLFTSDEDQDWLTDQLVAGALDVPELLGAFALEEAAPKVAKKVASKTRVRRA